MIKNALSKVGNSVEVVTISQGPARLPTIMSFRPQVFPNVVPAVVSKICTKMRWPFGVLLSLNGNQVIYNYNL